MKRTKKPTRKPTCLLTGDWHLREDQPVCRVDDYWTAQSKKLQYISELQEKYACPIYHSGDLFHHWKPSPYLLSTFMYYFSHPAGFITCLGNHDIPQHSLELVYRSGVWTLWTAGYITVAPTHWEREPETIPAPGEAGNDYDMLMWHIMTWVGERPWPGCEDPEANELIESVEIYEPDIILTGHNHKTFVVERDGRLLVNPGSMMRMAADQEDHEPCVFLWYAETNEVERVVLPHEKGVVSRDHIEAREGRDDSRYQAFIKGLQEDAPEISFRANLEEFFRQHNTGKKVKEMVWGSVED